MSKIIKSECGALHQDNTTDSWLGKNIYNTWKGLLALLFLAVVFFFAEDLLSIFFERKQVSTGLYVISFISFVISLSAQFYLVISFNRKRDHRTEFENIDTKKFIFAELLSLAYSWFVFINVVKGMSTLSNLPPTEMFMGMTW